MKSIYYLIFFAVFASISRVTQAINELPLPFGPNVIEDVFTAPNDDGSSIAIELPLDMKFFGEIVTQVFHNTNGDITFDSAYSTYTPEIIPSVSVPPMIAIYWTDIDTRNGGDDMNELWIRATTNSNDRVASNNIVRKIDADFTADAVIVATWNRVQAYNLRPGGENTFQLIVAYNGLKTYAIFAYKQLEFFTTETSFDTYVGLNDRQGIEGELFLVLDTQEGMENLLNGTNVDTPGLYVYSVGDTIELTGCGTTEAKPILSPFFGPVVGGTVVKVENLPVCLKDETIQIYCRFQGTDFDFVHQGTRVNAALVECVAPFVGYETSAEVSYAVHNPSDGEFIKNSANWVRVNNRFQYQGEMGSAVIVDSIGLVAAGTEIKVKWSSWSLLTVAAASLGTKEGIVVEIQVLLYNSVSKNFVVATSKTVVSSIEESLFTINDQDLTGFLASFSGQEYAAGLIRVVASLNGRVGSVTSSTLVAFITSDTASRLLTERGLGDTCPISTDNCPGLENLPPCPPDYPTANADPNFLDDNACSFPDGAANCDVDLDIYLDIDLTCYMYANDPLQCIYGDANLYVDTTACGCNFFHNGAAGCVRNSGSQCCYAKSGGLITDPNQGAGTADCIPAQGFFGVIGHFFRDVVPYVYCCKYLGGKACDDYFDKRPPVTDDGYVDPNRPGRGNGDPHFRTLDGLDYDFNGSGEYVAFCGVVGSGVLSAQALTTACGPNQPRLASGNNLVSLHLRFAPLSAGDQGTVTKAIAIADPLHRNGEQAIAIVPHPTRRFDVFDGNTRVIFPDTPAPESLVILDSGFYIKRIISEQGFSFVILSPSGCRLEASEVNGVWLPSFTPPPALLGRSVGLLGRWDDSLENDLLSGTGIQVGVSSSLEDIFSNFGQTWMIRDVPASLFKAFDDSVQAFDNFFDPDYIPAFEIPQMSPELQALADAACGGIASESIRNGCYFDIAVTENVDTFAATAEAAVEEERSRVTVITNNAPVLAQRTAEITLAPGNTASFPVSASDVDSDQLSLSLDRSDGGLFQLSVSGNGQGDLSFTGTDTIGTYYGFVGVSDGIEAVLFSVTVNVVAAAPTDAPTTNAPVDTPTTNAPVDTPTTNAPVNAPTTNAPVNAPTTNAPVNTPTTNAPVNTPTTNAPVNAPTTNAPVNTPTNPISTRCPSCPGIFSDNAQIKFDFLGIFCFDFCSAISEQIFLSIGFECGECD